MGRYLSLMLLAALAFHSASSERLSQRQLQLQRQLGYASSEGRRANGPYDGTMKVIPPPERDSFKDYRESNGTGPLFSLSDGDTDADPCRTDCSECPDIDSPGFEPANLAAGDLPCLCHAGYRSAVKAGDYRVRFANDDVPYEFLIAGAAWRTTAVQEAVGEYFLRSCRLVLAAGFASPDEENEKWIGHTLGKNAKRGVTMAAIRKIPWAGTFEEQMEALTELQFNIRSILTCLYQLLYTVYMVLNKMGEDAEFQDALKGYVDMDFFEFKKDYSDWFCQMDQEKESPCAFHLNVQRDKLLHEEHNFSQPFDGWFEWRFISKENDPDHPPQKGPFTPVFKDSLPDMNKVHVTKAILANIGASLDKTHGEEEKLDALLREHHGESWSDQDAVLPIGGGIAWWEQFDCDCSPLTCQPAQVANQLCEGGFNRVAGRVGGRSIAGPSGTTQKMMQNARLLKMTAQDLYLLRVGFIAWMVPTEDHSLFEIMMGAEGMGVPYPHDSRMYSVNALLPGEDLEAVREEMTGHLEALHAKFNLDFDAGEGPGALCK